jgi:hypothetical protein
MAGSTSHTRWLREISLRLQLDNILFLYQKIVGIREKIYTKCPAKLVDMQAAVMRSSITFHQGILSQ